MGLALFGILLIGTVTGAFFIVRAWNRREFQEGMLILRWGLVIWVAYLAALFAVALVTPEREVGGGEVRFCGIDPECMLSASVIRITYAKTFGDPPREMIAQGMYYFVTVRVVGTSPEQAIRPALTGVVVDAKGRKYPQATEAERAYRLISTRPTEPAMRGTSRTVMIFDLPLDIERPALIIREGSMIEDLFERFIVGDEASLFHPQTKLRLLKPEERPGS